MKKQLYFILLLPIGLVMIFMYQTSLVTNSSNNQYDTLRKVLETLQEQDFRKTAVNAGNVQLQYVPSNTNYTGNIPDVYLTDKKAAQSKRNCSRFPNLFDLSIKNDNWQMQKTTTGTFHLFNAYIDDRNGTVVRILGTYDEHHTKSPFYCQLWYSNSDIPKVVPSEVPLWLFSEKWGADNGIFDHPYLITCPVDEIPVSVSVVENPCDHATNNLKVFNKKVEEKKNFVVCVKGLSFPFEDKNTRLAEWIELLNILGAEKVNFYEFKVHPNTKKMLDYYVNEEKIEVTPLTLVGKVSNHPYLQSKYLRQQATHRRLQEVIPYNDCLYKHLNEFRFVVLLDIDEVIVPAQGTWIDLMETLQSTEPNRSSYMARNIYFLDSHLHQHDWFEDVPKYLHMLQHVYRAQNYTKPGYFVKGFHDTRMVIALHNHYPFKCNGRCTHLEMDPTLVHLQHYRSDCVAGVGDCDLMKVNQVLDDRVWQFKDELIKRVERTFSSLGFSYT